MRRTRATGELWQMELPGLGSQAEAEVRLEALPPDWRERERALDVGASWIVEAPAGSGKTGLLIQRYLKLLAEGGVDRPEQVLAMTFTNAAAAEIRERVLRELDGAAAGTAVEGAFEWATRRLAESVLERDRAAGWGLREDPGRLGVKTIDGVCAEIARALPVTGGGTAGLRPVEEAEPLYREAARRTLLQLGGADGALDAALRLVLLHRDGSLSDCETLVAGMLGTREQWGELVPLGAAELTEQVLDGVVKPRLDRALEMAVCQGLGRLADAFPPGVLQQMSLFAADFADLPPGKAGDQPFAICRNLRDVPGKTVADREHWTVLVELLTTKKGELRSAFHKGVLDVDVHKDDQVTLKQMAKELRDEERLVEALRDFRRLPPSQYPGDQWEVAKALFRVLKGAMVELQEVFAERGECDFAEPALVARGALREAAGEGVEAALGTELRHLLVDEVQDTSTGQYELLRQMTAGWAGEGRTVFLVGDPKQSIYLFRQARVERFVELMETGRMGEMELGRLQLTANFRSQAGLVRGFNGTFAEVFRGARESREDVAFAAAEAVRGEADGVAGEGGFRWHAAVVEEKEERPRVSRGNARRIREVAERWRARPLPAKRKEPWRIAVLVASRKDLRPVVAALAGDEAKGEAPIPFRAVKVDPLKERREVLDLLALTRALGHLGDRTAWWAVLRAPWCGLDLGELHVLAGEDDERLRERTVMELVRERGELLGTEGVARLERVWPVLEAAVGRRSRLRVPELVERTWRSLGGDAALGTAELGNAVRYLRLLEDVDRERGTVAMPEVRRRMERLFAEPATAEAGAVELMTIHGAKGLEWDVVLVPEMERSAPQERGRLLDWEELPGLGPEGAAGVVLAPIAGRGEDSQALNRWLHGTRGAREAAERRRVLYVACTRAREELHLFGTAVRGKGETKAEPRSLLEAAWPAAAQEFTGEVVAWPTAPVAAEPGEGLALAASGEEVEEGERPAVLERLPTGFDALGRFGGGALQGVEAAGVVRMSRPQGSFRARCLGNAVHAFLELAARRMAEGVAAGEMLVEAAGWRERVAAVLRGDGLRAAEVEELTREVMGAVARTLKEPMGVWMLGARTEARTEFALTARGGDGWRRVRMDRVFRAGEAPGEVGEGCVWVVDYKTSSHGSAGVEEFLERERGTYEAQMEGYARALGGDGIRLGLWYPMLGRLVWWVAGSLGGDAVMADVKATDPEDDVFGDVGGVVADAL